jgi:transposase
VLSVPGDGRIVLYLPPTDMRKSFRGLSALVVRHLGTPADGTLYVFANRRRTHVKILYFDGDGLAIWYKRLERGRFPLPAVSGDRAELSRRDLAMLLEGVVPLAKLPRFRLGNRPS